MNGTLNSTPAAHPPPDPDADSSPPTTTHTHDILIVGAGISGINTAYRVQTRLPHSTYTILEARPTLGGTWSLFRYPGIRSDSDLHSFGFSFHPWRKSNPIATGPSIIEYLHATARKFGIEERIQYGRRVERADWSSDTQQWRVEVSVAEGEEEGARARRARREVHYARFVVMGTGYFDYEKPLDAEIPGLERFRGETVHPQFWPEGLDFGGKKMVVIGSGATAITIVPAVVDAGVGHVTMLQRSPSYVLSVPQGKPDAPLPLPLRFLPESFARRFVRWIFILQGYLLFVFCRTFPRLARRVLRSEAKRHLPKGFAMDPHFEPRYEPWDQRMCLCPDGDFFRSFGTGRAAVVTGQIKSVVEDGIELESGEKLEADIIVTATGLRLSFCGKIALSVDKEPVELANHFLWRTCMINEVPNLAVMVGYVNASWTLGSDTSARLFTRLIRMMEENKYTSARARISNEERRNWCSPLGLQSTYVRKALADIPKAGTTGPWRPRNNYFQDRWASERADLRDGLYFES